MRSETDTVSPYPDLDTGSGYGGKHRIPNNRRKETCIAKKR